MTDEKFDQLMHDAAATYNRPPDVLPLDEMWQEITKATLAQAATAPTSGQSVRTAWLERAVANPWLRVAAVLLIGLALGRLSHLPGSGADPVPETAVASVAPQYAPVTDTYLGQAASLLISLPTQLPEDRADSTFQAGTRELLLQTRLLLDSPAIGDPTLRTLLEDLEVLLVQLVRLGSDPMKLDLLRESLNHTDVIPRLRSAVAEYITD